VVDPRSGYETIGGVAGTSMAAVFLYLIAALNIIVLAGIVKVFRGLRAGAFDEAELERQLAARGMMWRFFGRFMRSITKSWHMLFVGLIFGIGFDTATEVLLLAATAAAATKGLPWYAVAALPLLFAGGMTLFDTADGCFMNFAYGWAFARPARKVYYNLIITGLSIAVAFLIGTIEITDQLAAELHIHGPVWDAIVGFDINRAGFIIAALFAAVWAIAITYWKLARLDQRWAPATAGGQAQAPNQARGNDTHRRSIQAQAHAKQDVTVTATHSCSPRCSSSRVLGFVAPAGDGYIHFVAVRDDSRALGLGRTPDELPEPPT